MQAEGNAIFSYFTSQTGFTDVVGSKLYPLVAKEDVERPFAVYTITEDVGETKDADKVTVSLSVYFDSDNYLTAAGFADTIKSIIKANRDYSWISSNPGVIEDDRSVFIDTTFELINV